MSYPEVPLKRFGRLVGGTTPGSDERFWDGGETWYTPTDVSRVHGGVLAASARTLTPAALSETSLLQIPSGSVIFTSRAPVGNVAITARASTTNQGCKALIPSGDVDPRFVTYAATVRTEALRAAGTGTTFIEVSGERLGAVSFPKPPPDVQRIIADFLAHEDERIARAREGAARVIRALSEPALALAASEFDEQPLGRIGYRFEVQLGKMLDEKRVDRSDTQPYLRNANVHWDELRLADLKEMTFSDGDRRRFALVPGDLLVCEGGEPGRAAVWNGEVTDCYFQKALHRVRPYGEDSSRYLLWALRILSLRSTFAVDGPGRYTHLTAEMLRAVRVPMPQPAVQHERAAVIDATSRRARAARAALEDLTAKLAEYRDALITEAVTGQLDVTKVSDAQMDERLEAATSAPGS